MESEPSEQDALTEVALLMYLGEACKLCLRILTLKDLRNAIWAGEHEGVAHKECWEKNNSNQE